MNKIIYVLCAVIIALVFILGIQQLSLSDTLAEQVSLSEELEECELENLEWTSAIDELNRLTDNEDRCYSACMEQYYYMDDDSGICRCYKTESDITGIISFTVDPINNKALNKLME